MCVWCVYVYMYIYFTQNWKVFTIPIPLMLLCQVCGPNLVRRSSLTFEPN